MTPLKDLATALNFIVGPEISGDKNPIRWVVDLTGSYTGVKDWTFGLNFDYGWQANDVFLTSQGEGDKSAAWYGLAGYVAFDFLERFRVSARGEWFNDPQGVRTATPGGVTLYSATGTFQRTSGRGSTRAASTGTTMPASPSSAAGLPRAARRSRRTRSR